MATPSISNSFIPIDLANNLYHREIPWEFSPEVTSQMQPIPSNDLIKYRTYKVIKGPEYDFAVRYFLANKPLGYGIKEIEVIDNPTLKKSFEASLVTMDTQAQNPIFAPTWQNDLQQTVQRNQVIQDWEKSVMPYSPVKTSEGELISHAKVLPLLHGSSESKTKSICSTGFVYFGKHYFFNPKLGLTTFSTDQGFFGSGIYMTDSFDYAKKYSKEGMVVLCWVAHRSPFPVVSNVKHPRKCSDMNLLEGRERFLNHNMHIIPIAKVKDLLYYPCSNGQKAECKEYVVFEPAQVLPRMIIRLTPDGPQAPLAKTYSVEEFYQACQQGNRDQIRIWLQEDKKRIHDKYANGESCLYPAVFGNQIAVLDWLYQQSPALLEVKREDNSSILHLATAAGFSAIVKWIMHYAPHLLNSQNEQGHTPLYLAAYFEQKEILEIYIDEVKKDPQIVLKLAQTPNTEILVFLADKGVPLNVTNTKKQTLLHIAAASGQLQNVELFLQRGANIDTADQNGRTALFLAVTQGQERVVQFLVQQGARVDHVAEGGETLFHPAAFYGYVSLLEILYPRASHLINQPDQDGKSPLHKAVWGQPKPHMVKWLIDHGANVHAKNFNNTLNIAFNYTPLHWAAKHGHFISAQYLLQNGAEGDVTNLNGETPLELASRYGHDNVAKLLIDPQFTGSPEQLFLQPPTKAECFEKFKQAVKDQLRQDQLLCLEKLAEIFLQEKKYLECTLVLTRTFALAEKLLLFGYQKLISKKMEKIEGQFIAEKFGTKLSANSSDYLSDYRTTLTKLRTTLQISFDNNASGKDLQKTFCDKYQPFIAKIVQQCIEMIEMKAPIPFCIVGFGDLARSEMLPFSQLQFGIVGENEGADKEIYVSNLCQLIELRILNLSAPNLEELKSIESLVAPEIFKSKQTPTEFKKYSSKSWLVWGEKSVYDTCQKGMQDSLNQKVTFFGKTQRKEIALTELQKAIQQNASSIKTVTGNISFDKQLYQPVFQMIHNLGLYFEAQQSNAFDILNDLENKQLISQPNVRKLEQLLNKLIRWKAHDQFKQEKEGNPSLIELIQNGITTKNELLEAFQVVIPFYRACEDFTQKDSKALLSHNFFDPSITIQI